MWDSSWWDGPVVENWGTTLLHFLWQGALVVSVHAIGTSLLARSASPARYWWGVGCLLALSLFPLMTFGWLLAQVQVLDTSVSTALTPDPAVTDLADLPPATDLAIPLQGWAASNLRTVTDCRGWLLCAWSLGVITLSIRLVAGGWIVYRLRRRLTPLTEPLNRQVDKLQQRLQVSSRIVVATSSRVTTAIACGLFRPLVLLPTAWLTEMSPCMLEAVIAHELAHIRRCDLWINLWQRIIETLWFYHPAVWWISASIRRERETCCDDLAVAALQDRVQYAATLEFLAKSRFAGTTPPWLSAGLGGRRMLLLNRVRHVLGVETPRGLLTHWPAICAVALLCVGAATLIRGSQTAVADEPDPDQIMVEYQLAAEEYQQAAQAAGADERNSDRTAEGDQPAATELEQALAVRQQAAEEAQAAQRHGPMAEARVRVLIAAQEAEDVDEDGKEHDQSDTSNQAIRRLRRELDQAKRQLHESQRVIEKLERELAQVHERFDPQKRHVVTLAEVEPDSASDNSPVQRSRTDREASQLRRSAASNRMAQHERRGRQLSMEQELLEHRRQRLEEQMEQSHARHQQELALRQQAIQLDFKHRMQQLALRRELTQLQHQREDVRHQHHVGEIRERMNEIRRQLKQSGGPDEQRELQQEMNRLGSELETIEAEQEITRKYHDVESQAEQAEIESSLQSELKKLELDTKLQTENEVESLRSELQALELEKMQLMLQRELQLEGREN